MTTKRIRVAELAAELEISQELVDDLITQKLLPIDSDRDGAPGVDAAVAKAVVRAYTASAERREKRDTLDAARAEHQVAEERARQTGRTDDIVASMRTGRQLRALESQQTEAAASKLAPSRDDLEQQLSDAKETLSAATEKAQHTGSTNDIMHFQRCQRQVKGIEKELAGLDQ